MAINVGELKLLIEKVVNFEFEVFGVDGAVEILECDEFFIVCIGVGELLMTRGCAELVSGDRADGEGLLSVVGH